MKLKNSTGSLFLHHSSGGWDGGKGRFHWVSMEWDTFLNIQNLSAQCRVSKGDQSHFEALGLHLFVKDVRCCLNDYANSSKPTCSWHQVPMHSLFLGGSSSETHDWIRPTLERLAHSKDFDTWQSHLLLNWTLTLQKIRKGNHKNNEWGLKRNLEKCKKYTSNKQVQTPLLLWD